MIVIKIIFLDVDGVLNSENFFKSRSDRNCDLDETRVILLKQIIEHTDAKIVLSSSWRNNRNFKEYDQLPKMLSKYGIEIIDYTKSFGERGKEIQQWLDDNKNKNIEKFIILDDDSFDMGKFVGNELIQTSWYDGFGLMEEHVATAIKKLT